jgi:hypothetical protein
MTLSPAYGRDYKSAKAIKDDFAADKDFIIEDFTHPNCGQYINRTQLLEAGTRTVNIRYKKKTAVTVIKVK